MKLGCTHMRRRKPTAADNMRRSFGGVSMGDDNDNDDDGVHSNPCQTWSSFSAFYK